VFFVQLNDYLVTGTRQQYWEELFVKHIMEVRTNSTGYSARKHFFFQCSKSVFLPVFEIIFLSVFVNILSFRLPNKFSSNVRNNFFFLCLRAFFLPVFETIFCPCSKPNIATFCQVPASLFPFLPSELYVFCRTVFHLEKSH